MLNNHLNILFGHWYARDYMRWHVLTFIHFFGINIDKLNLESFSGFAQLNALKSTSY